MAGARGHLGTERMGAEEPLPLYNRRRSLGEGGPTHLAISSSMTS